MWAMLTQELKGSAERQGETDAQESGEHRKLRNRQSKRGSRGIGAGLVHLLRRAVMTVMAVHRRRAEGLRA